ncbi:hypothetical protein DFJ58DRAFT_733659 [Suillus subalutaceus]|uniref:uncharacterized protein n=1 Tax=Suillus subalutaceus TaxID=48586 RepID=UPI001B87087B|nr:uncharacterized protein DFJ58DRAFT_733659 [Suillus subalutaceus]KAG1838714.1 hypothetical protein DFJ58DRAFT_733659 [Suillus subalutaceus]
MPAVFDRADLQGFRAAKEIERLDMYHGDPEDIRSSVSANDGWQETSVKIRIPADGVAHKSLEDAPEFSIPGLFYRRPIEIIKNAFHEASAEHFHFTPFEQHYLPSPDRPPERIYSKIYTSPAMLEEHDCIRSQPREDGCTLETVVAAIMLWSDSTHLASFGTTSLWPIYLFLGNQSKYDRKTLSDIIQDFYCDTFGKAATAQVLTHCRHELMQAIWLLLMDNDFMHAYEFGIVIECLDGIRQRIFPRFFTYSADYPEKTLLACIKFLAQCPCPRCLTLKSKIGDLGKKVDRYRRERYIHEDSHWLWSTITMVQDWLYRKGVNITSKHVKDNLGPRSLIPTLSAFSTQLKHFGVNFYELFVPDLLHEFKLGVWKAVFTHLIRILYVHGEEAIQKLNRRFCQVPTFGRGTIRRFSNNASGMKHLAGRDFEDLLQCAIPVFEGLLPSLYNEPLLDLLFELAMWHGLAKLRMHTDMTLNFLDLSTTRRGQFLRNFMKATAKEYVMKDLPSEEAARGHRKANKAAKGTGNSTDQGPRRSGQQMSSPKLHALGDYVEAIQKFGTSNNYSTQPGECEHRRVKWFYPCVSKAKFTAGIAKQQRRERILFKMAEGSPYEKKGKGKQDAGKQKRVLQLSSPDAPALRFEDSQPLPYSDPQNHYHISTSTRYHINIYKWLAQHKSDPALNNFLPRLKEHLLSRLRGLEYDGDEREFTSAERSTVILIHEKIFHHKVLCVNYTTYDLRCDQDSLNPRTNADVMLLAHEDGGDGHPYWYAQILGVFHTLIIHTGEHSKSHEPQQMDFLWVRWFGRDPGTEWHPYTAGWKVKRLKRVGFIPSDDPGAIGFLDPQQVIHGIHLVPAFHYGHTDTLLPPSIARLTHNNNEDWTFLYVNMFVDRDMMMHFCGGGVGHKSTWQATNWFLSDQFNDEMDDMEIEDAEFDSDEGELHGDAEMEDTEIEGAEQPGLDSDEEADEDEIEEYGYDSIEELEESDENEDEDGGDDGGATSESTCWLHEAHPHPQQSPVPPGLRGSHPSTLDTTGHFHPRSGYVFGLGKNLFDRLQEDQYNYWKEVNTYYPFHDEGEWELAMFLVENLNQTQIDKFLKLKWFNTRPKPSFTSKDQLLDWMDAPPRPAEWNVSNLEFTGYKTICPIQLIWCDALEVVKQLFSDPVFANHITFQPHILNVRNQRKYGDYMSGNFAWKIQDCLPLGATQVPIILGSDRTPVMRTTGGLEMHPIFITIGNLDSEVRSKATL